MMKKGANNGSMKSSSCSSNYCYKAEHTDYNILEEIGNGASAIVYRAIYVPTNEIVAVKCLDLDRCNSNLDGIRRETQTMSLIDHPNLIKSYCSFVVEHFLWVVMPFMAEGSCLHLMKTSYTDGFEESVICSILKETLRALEYLHRHGHIHRDIKASNILLDNSGLVKLGDFGVSACMFDQGDRKRARNTFVGTPCWMAPEVLQPGGGYDFKKKNKGQKHTFCSKITKEGLKKNGVRIMLVPGGPLPVRRLEESHFGKFELEFFWF